MDRIKDKWVRILSQFPIHLEEVNYTVDVQTAVYQLAADDLKSLEEVLEILKQRLTVQDSSGDDAVDLETL